MIFNFKTDTYQIYEACSDTIETLFIFRYKIKAVGSNLVQI